MLRRQVPIGILSTPTVLAGGGIKISYTLADTFTTDKSAGAVHNTACEPGPGTRTVVDTGNLLSLSSGSAVIAGMTVSTSDPRLYIGEVTRSAGIAMGAVLRYAASGGRALIGFGQTAAPTLERFSMASSLLSANNVFIGPAAHETDYTISIILRSTGAFYIVSGGEFGSSHRLVRVTSSDNTATLYPAVSVSSSNSASSCSEMKVAQLGGPWLDTYGPGALHTSGAVAASTSFTHEANFFASFTLTNNGSAGDTVIKFRMQDATNYWKLTIGNDGAADLSEVVAGSATSRGTAAAGVFADGETIQILVYDTKIYVIEVNSTRISYTSAANFQTATAGELTSLATDAVVSNLELYPVDLSGAALGWVEALAVPL